MPPKEKFQARLLWLLGYRGRPKATLTLTLRVRAFESASSTAGTAADQTQNDLKH